MPFVFVFVFFFVFVFVFVFWGCVHLLTRDFWPPVSLLCSLPMHPDEQVGPRLREGRRNTIVKVVNSNSSIVCYSSPKYTGDQFYFSGPEARVTVRSYNQVSRATRVVANAKSSPFC